MKTKMLVLPILCMYLGNLNAHSIKEWIDFPKASLKITVRDELGNTVSDAAVMIYKTEKDYINETHAIRKGITDKKGIVKFKGLESVKYYVIVRKGAINNAGGGEQIGMLKNGTLNKVTIIIQ